MAMDFLFLVVQLNVNHTHAHHIDFCSSNLIFSMLCVFRVKQEDERARNRMDRRV